MKKSNIILLAIVIVSILISLYYIFFINTSSNLSNKELRDFAVEDTASVNKIFMVDKSNAKVLLERKHGYWQINKKYRVRKDAIALLLKTINRVAIKSPVSKSAHNTVVKNLAVHSTKVEIYANNKLIRTYYVGGPTSDQYGTYMLIEGSSVPFIMHIPGFSGYLSTRYFVEEGLWRSMQIFNYQYKDIVSILVEIPLAPSKSFKIINNGDNNFALESVYQQKMINDFDTIAVKKYIANYKNISYQALLNNFDQNKKDSIISTQPYYIFTVEDKNGIKQTIKTYKMPSFDDMLLDGEGNKLDFDPDQMYGYINDEDFVSVQYYVFDNLIKEIDNFLKK